MQDFQTMGTLLNVQVYVEDIKRKYIMAMSQQTVDK